jgi:hypothetical protein
MKQLLENDTEEEKIKNSTVISCKFCKSDIDLTQMRQLPKKRIIEKHGVYWTGLERVYLIIYKIQCQRCKKKYSHKIFKSDYHYT